MKQQIEIDVPDGYEAITLNAGDEYGNPLTILIKLQKKEPEFIEVRLCLVARWDGVHGIFAHDKRNIRPTGFVKYLEDQWRKVEI